MLYEISLKKIYVDATNDEEANDIAIEQIRNQEIEIQKIKKMGSLLKEPKQK